eukprot:11224505-Alexandrium_andersonii.AAC.1
MCWREAGAACICDLRLACELGLIWCGKGDDRQVCNDGLLTLAGATGQVLNATADGVKVLHAARAPFNVH